MLSLPIESVRRTEIIERIYQRVVVTDNPLYVPHQFYRDFFEFTGIDSNRPGINVEYSHVPIEGPVLKPNDKITVKWWSP